MLCPCSRREREKVLRREEGHSLEPVRRNSKADTRTVDAVGEQVSVRDMWSPLKYISVMEGRMIHASNTNISQALDATRADEG